jgi:hypothetical protein
MAVGRSGEASGHVVAEKRDGGGVAAVGHRQRAAGFGVVLGVGERRLRAEGDIRQIDAAVQRRGVGRAGVNAAAVGDRRVGDLDDRRRGPR